ncbi:ankyrin [Fusarium agapanthi]|uniref:Ankyrin n=1 Tax=Fusarium agapanthi TaxID=1803897 RepID=A0A9P5AXM0_9HYPO|nr:ankyrin [Fusarium agapanthi]
MHSDLSSSQRHMGVSIEEIPREMTTEVTEEKLQRIITTVNLLLGSNPETISTQDMYGNTPLHYAAKTYSNCGRKYTAVSQFLCDRGADASILNKKSETALHCLCHDNGGWPIDTAALEILLRHSAMVTGTEDNDNTPLHLVVKNLENLDAIVFLLDHGADISTKNLKGNTPLHEAANGMFWPGVVEEKYKSMGEILGRLQGDEGRLMHHPNTEGKSPRQVQDERRKNFREQIDDIESGWKWWGS